MCDSTAIAEMQAAFGWMRVRADLRNHFYAGAMAALTALSKTDSSEERAAAIQMAQDEYVTRLVPDPITKERA